MEQEPPEERKGRLDALTTNLQDCSWGTDTKEEPASKANEGLAEDMVVDTDEEPARYTEEDAMDEPEKPSS